MIAMTAQIVSNDAPPSEHNEIQRLATLRHYSVLDTPREEAFDRIVRLAALMFRMPVAGITFIGERRQWFKACFGLDIRETRREDALCAYTILSNEILQVPDTAADARFAANPLVTGAPGIRFYAGAPLITYEGHRLGALCLIDTAPREALCQEEEASLAQLATLVVDQLEARLVQRAIAAELAGRSRAEHASRDLTNLLDSVVAKVPDPLYVKDRKDRYVIVNDAFATLAGSPRKAIIGLRDGDLFSTSDILPTETANRASMDSAGEYRVEQTIDRNGQARTFVVTEIPWHDADGQVLGLVGLSKDITEERRAEEAVRVSEALNRGIVDSTADAIKVIDVEGNLLFINGAGLRMLEIEEPAPVIGRRWTDFWPEEVRPKVEAAMTTAREGGTGRFTALRPPKTGTPKWWDVIVIAVLDGKQHARRLLAVSRDVTAETEVKTALRDAKTAAEAANGAKSAFLATMSHELRTPLNAIIGFSEIIRDATMGPVAELYRQYADDIHTSGQHLLRLICDVLDLSKIEAERLDLDNELVDVAEIVNVCCRLLGKRAATGGVALVVDLSPDLPNLMADAMRLKQILLNLLSNAIKFTPAGGQVILSAEPAADNSISITVRDNGIGMKASDIPLALEPFRQIDGPLIRRYEGTGLGLPLAQRLVELHGGRLQIISEPGVGTTVAVFFPVGAPN